MSSSTMSQRAVPDSTQDWLDRARRQRLRGDRRKALLLLREACCRHAGDARLWALYGVQCWRMARHDDARTAMRQALWLREREQDQKRAHVLRALLVTMESALAHQVAGDASQRRARWTAGRSSSTQPALTVTQ